MVKKLEPGFARIAFSQELFDDMRPYRVDECSLSPVMERYHFYKDFRSFGDALEFLEKNANRTIGSIKFTAPWPSLRKVDVVLVASPKGNIE